MGEGELWSAFATIIVVVYVLILLIKRRKQL